MQTMRSPLRLLTLPCILLVGACGQNSEGGGNVLPTGLGGTVRSGDSTTAGGSTTGSTTPGSTTTGGTSGGTTGGTTTGGTTGALTGPPTGGTVDPIPGTGVLQSRAAGTCLGVASITQGAAVVGVPCAPADLKHMWAMASDGHVRLGDSNECLSRADDNVSVELMRCDDAPIWAGAGDDGTLRPDSDTNACITMTADGSAVQLVACGNATVTQQWVFSLPK